MATAESCAAAAALSVRAASSGAGVGREVVSSDSCGAATRRKRVRESTDRAGFEPTIHLNAFVCENESQ